MSENSVNLNIAVKLKIMKKRIKCVLIQIHYMKNILLNEDSFFAKLCSENTTEQAMKVLNKKVLNVDIKTNKSILEPLILLKSQILENLQFHYHTLTDVLEIKDHVIDLLGQISALQLILDIKTNTHLTELYLDLVIDYVRIMIILSGIPEIRLILVVYNLAFFFKFDQDELFYHRLCERLVERHKDHCIEELHNELYPYCKVLLNALRSVSDLLMTRLVPASDWDEKNVFELVLNDRSERLTYPSLISLIPLSHIHRWLLFGYLIAYTEILPSPSILFTFQSVINAAMFVRVFRDEYLNVHSFLINFFGSNEKSLAKLVKESQRDIGSKLASFHRTRREYLRLAMHNQLQVLTPQLGIMGPNSLILCYTLTLANDEIHWLLAHMDSSLVKKTSGKNNLDNWDYDHLADFLFQMEEIRYLLQQFGVVEEYHKRLLEQHDSPTLHHLISSNSVDDHIDTLELFLAEITDPVTGTPTKPYKGLRLDWLKLQTWFSLPDANDTFQVTELLNITAFHTHLVDNLQKFISKLSSQRLFFFHRATFESLLSSNLKCANQLRYIAIFARLCEQFIDNCTMDCPEDFNKVLSESSIMMHNCLSLINQELCQRMIAVVKVQFKISSQCLAVNAVDLYHQYYENRQKGKGQNRKKLNERENFDIQIQSLEYDINVLSELAGSLNCRPFRINNHTLYPSNYLRMEVYEFLSNKLVSMAYMKYERDKHETTVYLRKPSEMKLLITECLSVLTRIHNCVDINVSVLLLDVFLNQSLPKDSAGQMTLTEIYSKWYVNLILNQRNILHSPILKCFVTINPSNQKEVTFTPIKSEEYTDTSELQALVEIIGPYGMQNLSEEIMEIVITKVGLLQKFVQQNRATLVELNVLNLDSNRIKKLLDDLEDVEDFCKTCRQIGILLAFTELYREAIEGVTRRTVPFLRATVDDILQGLNDAPFHHLTSISDNGSSAQPILNNQLVVNELCKGFGLNTKIDCALVTALRTKRLEQQQFQCGLQQDYDNQKNDLQNELLIVAISYLLPKFVGSNFYRIEYEALENNAHCTAYTIKELMYAFFGHSGDDTVKKHIRKFIGITSSNLLRLGLDDTASYQTNKEDLALINNRESIYMFFDYVIRVMGNVTESFYEECFPYALVRQAYQTIVRQSRQTVTNDVTPSNRR